MLPNALDDIVRTPARKRKAAGSDTGPVPLVDRAPRRQVALSSANGRLLWWDEVPAQLQFNRYIASGYRANISYGQCLCSLFQVHNETGNVWAHFGPAMLVAGAVLALLRSPETQHRAVFLTVLLPELLCLLLSSAYHLFMAQVKQYDFWLKVDVCGIFSLMMVPYFVVVWWGYRCQPAWRMFVLIAYYASAFSALLSSALASSIFWRALPMGALALIRALSLAHRAYLGTSSHEALAYFFCMEATVTVGALINVYRVPERWLHVKQPTTGKRRAGLLDYWGNSHQLMHCCAVLAMWCVFKGTAAESRHLLTYTCPS